MPYSPPDTPPSDPGQMPQASTPGPAPVPYGGPGSAIGPHSGAPVPDVSFSSTPGPGVLAGVTGANDVTESPLAAPNVNPFEAGSPDPIYTGAAADAGGRDTVSASVAAAVAAAEARFGEHETDTYAQGSTIGDLMDMPPVSTPGYYDPPRDYGD